MKTILFSFSLLVSVLTISCKKENEVKPQAPEAAAIIDVEYRVACTSGSFVVDYLAPNSSGTLEMKHDEISRTEETISFSFKSGNRFVISASNAIPSHDVIQVQIYVNGVLKVENSTTNPSQKAVAEGNF
ncbi:MAG TPA: hypothetical protein VGC65_12705 [Bacteroidia bacterium]|jgi:hypothetical protein